MITTVDTPTRVDGVQLLGAMVGSGYRTPPRLVRRGDGQTLQLTPLLYTVLDAVDGRRSYAEIADAVCTAMRRSISEETVAKLVDQHLRPQGLLKLADGSEPPLKRSNPLLALKFKLAVTNPRTTRLLTDPFRILFRPVLVIAVVIGFLAVTWWVFFERGLAPAAYDAFQRPQLLLLVFVVTVLSGGFHEFGHAAAARYSGADPGVIGAGLYIVWPAFYTDVTDSYRLGRGGRIRTDLGGLYFNALVVVLTFGWWYTTRWDALLLLVATQILQMVHQLLPLLRYDGYHLLADLTGVPDLWLRIGPTLTGLLPHRWSDPKHRVLKPWARAVITVWVLVTIPMMALMLMALVAAIPRLLGSAGAVVHEDAGGVMSAWRSGAGLIDVSGHALQVLGVVLPLLGCILIFGRIVLRSSRGLARWSRGSVSKRVVAAALIAFVITTLSWAWWPRPGTYRPIGPGEKGLLTALLPTVHATGGTPVDQVPGGRPRAAPAYSATSSDGVLPVGASAERRLAGGAPLEATFPRGQSLPTRSDPQLAIVLVPAADSHDGNSPASNEPAEGSGDGHSSAPDQPAESEEPWVFPFDRPLPPEEGDNQAAAFNTTDDSTIYDVAFALVWATGDEVLNVNEAHAYASCSNCVTVAVAFQVVLIMDDAQVVVPQNLSVAANFECFHCITAAIASQLVLSVEETPGEEQLLALGEVWNRLTEFGRAITTFSITQITTQLDEFTSEIVAILDSTPPVQPNATPDATQSPAQAPTGGSTEPSTTSVQPGPSPTDASADTQPSSPSPSEPTHEPTLEPTLEPTPAPASEPTTEPTAKPETEPETQDATSNDPTSAPPPSPSASP